MKKSTKPLEILMVEDDLSQAKAMKSALFKYSVDIAANLEDALNMAKNKDYSLYFTDGSYPLRKGERENKRAWIQFYEQLTEMKGNVPVILVSSYDLKGDASDFGMRYLPKPVNLKEMRELIEEYSRR